MAGLLGKKVGMTRIFTANGQWIDVTVLEAGPCTVVQRKTLDNDGYDAVQLGFGEAKEKGVNKPQMGHFKKAGIAPKRDLRELRVKDDCELKVGDELKADFFTTGDRVDVAGTTKGRGFSGFVRRHRMAGGPETHGSNFHRRPGSIGSSADPSRVFKGTRMAGRMGHDKVTVQNLEVVEVDPVKNLLVVRGCVPGANGGLVIVRKSVKRKKGAS